MKKRITLISLVIMVLFMAIGIFLVIHANSYGWDAANAAVQANGGSMDTTRMYMIAEATTKSYQIIGSIVLAIGGLGTLLSGWGFYKQL